MADASAGPSTSAEVAAPTSATANGAEIAGEDKGKKVDGGELEEESVYREKELSELESLISPDLKEDIGCSVSGLYDLVGKYFLKTTSNFHHLSHVYPAIVTHKGAAADAGHYIGFVKKSVFRGGKSPVSNSTDYDEDDEDWYKFDDEKVSVFPKEKLATLDGGGKTFGCKILRMLAYMLFATCRGGLFRLCSNLQEQAFGMSDGLQH